MISEKLYIVPDDKLLINTLDKMRAIEKKSIEQPEFLEFASGFKKFYFSNDLIGFLIWDYMRKHFKYVSDSIYKNDDELLISPLAMLSRRAGDCDDFSLFTRSVLTAMDLNSNYLLFGKTKNNFSHVGVLFRGNLIDGTIPIFNYYIKIKYPYVSKVIFSEDRILLQKLRG